MEYIVYHNASESSFEDTLHEQLVLFIFLHLSSYDGDKDGGRMELWETNPKSWRLFW
jgi:hypothetical protein